MDPRLDLIRDFADKAHGDQLRKYTPDRYIVHPVKVMNICREYTSDITILAAALLHDVLEDTETKPEEIHKFLLGIMTPEETDKTLHLVNELTDEFIKSRYPQWNRKKRKLKETTRMKSISGDAQTIKYADVMENSQEIIEQDPAFADRYVKECKNLLEVMTKGNPQLYERSKQTINNCLTKLKEMKLNKKTQ